MRYSHTSVFNLIKIFRQGKSKIVRQLNAVSHCEHQHIHDYYCDAERPFIQ